MSDHARQAGTGGGLSLTFGSAIYEWLFSNGFLSLPTIFAALGLIVTIVINLDKIVANIRFAARGFRPEPAIVPPKASLNGLKGRIR